MRELSLFSGAGGGLLGTKLLGWTHIGYVEFNDYCQQVIAQRIKDGILDEAPIFTDVREFLQSGAARQYRGFTDVVTAGFPCQPFSVAGKQQGKDDPRNMWPATIAIIRAVRPNRVFLENVPGLLSPWRRFLIRLIPSGQGWFRRIATEICFPSYFGRVLGDLAESGFNAKWRMLSAAEVGAPHKRDRVFILCHSEHDGLPAAEITRGITAGNGSNTTGQKQTSKLERSGRKQKELADTNSIGSSGSWWSKEPCYTTEEEYREINRAFNGSRWGIESPICRVATKSTHSMDQLKALGNMQIPIMVKTAWELLTTDG